MLGHCECLDWVALPCMLSDLPSRVSFNIGEMQKQLRSAAGVNKE